MSAHPQTRRHLLASGLSLLGAAALAPARSLAEPVAPVEVLCRALWGAAPARTEGLVEHRLHTLTIHHTAAAWRQGQDPAARLRGYQRYHQGLGWPDIAYHMLIDAEGTVYQGRSALYRGDTATDYDPTGHLLICLDGNFDQHPLPEAQYRALVRMVAWGTTDHPIPWARVGPHRAHAHPACPGAAVMVPIESGALARDVAAAGAPRVRLRCA